MTQIAVEQGIDPGEDRPFFQIGFPFGGDLAANRVRASRSLLVAAQGAGSGADGYRSSITTGERSSP